ncbi:MAG: sigma-54 dependent transcriptional regulator [Comamonas sp.]
MISSVAARILVVEDEPDLRTLYELTLLREGHQVDTADDVATGLLCLQQQPYDAIIADMSLPDGTGLALLEAVQAPGRRERCLIITADGSAESAVSALKAGAFDYLTKPIDLSQLRRSVASAIQQERDGTPSVARASAHGVPDTAAAALHRLAGESASMQAVRARIQRVARSMAPVLIQGESGTGKELAARAVHTCSHRAEGPFVAVNCSAIPENLLEAEFFGSRKGAFTGATHDRDGFFQAAHGGTLFLDEIGDLPLPMQAKLLRAIQERVVRPLGSTQEFTVDVRIVSATHKDLATGVSAGLFRRDLFYRLNVIDIALPALRERREDIPLLCQSLLARIAQDSGLPTPALGDDLLAQLMAQPLRGNVRELENLLHRAIALSDGHRLSTSLVPDMPRGLDDTAAGDASWPAPSARREPAAWPDRSPRTSPTPLSGATDAMRHSAEPIAAGSTATHTAIPHDLQAHLDAYEAEIIRRALEAHQFNRTATAARLGLSLRQIRYRIARLNIEVPGQEPDNLTLQAIAAIEAQDSGHVADHPVDNLRLTPLPTFPG